jgi:hypothetical protein
MKKEESEPDFAASRIKKVHDREKPSLLKGDEKGKSHAFSFQKRPSSLPKVAPNNLPSSSRQLKAKPSTDSSNKQTAMAAGAFSQNQNYPLELIDKLEALQSKVVKNLRVKEQIIAARRLKAIGSEIQEWMFTRFQWQARQMLENKQEEEMLPVPVRQEERQFRITRIIPFL